MAQLDRQCLGCLPIAGSIQKKSTSRIDRAGTNYPTNYCHVFMIHWLFFLCRQTCPSWRDKSGKFTENGTSSTRFLSRCGKNVFNLLMVVGQLLWFCPFFFCPDQLALAWFFQWRLRFCVFLWIKNTQLSSGFRVSSNACSWLLFEGIALFFFFFFKLVSIAKQHSDCR